MTATKTIDASKIDWRRRNGEEAEAYLSKRVMIIRTKPPGNQGIVYTVHVEGAASPVTTQNQGVLTAYYGERLESALAEAAKWL